MAIPPGDEDPPGCREWPMHDPRATREVSAADFPQEFPLLHALSGDKARVFEVCHSAFLRGNCFRLVEVCDGFFSESFSREDMLKLADEIKRFAEKQEPSP